jgi:hypothetical protein
LSPSLLYLSIFVGFQLTSGSGGLATRIRSSYGLGKKPIPAHVAKADWQTARKNTVIEVTGTSDFGHSKTASQR